MNNREKIKNLQKELRDTTSELEESIKRNEEFGEQLDMLSIKLKNKRSKNIVLNKKETDEIYSALNSIVDHTNNINELMKAQDALRNEMK